jgi:hypothetical protein
MAGRRLTDPGGWNFKRERGFVLDGGAVNWIPQYNSQHDVAVSKYFRNSSVQRVLQATGQAGGGSSIEGHLNDGLYRASKNVQYLQERNTQGYGHARELFAGHLTISQRDIKSVPVRPSTCDHLSIHQPISPRR